MEIGQGQGGGQGERERERDRERGCSRVLKRQYNLD